MTGQNRAAQVEVGQRKARRRRAAQWKKEKGTAQWKRSKQRNSWNRKARHGKTRRGITMRDSAKSVRVARDKAGQPKARHGRARKFRTGKTAAHDKARQLEVQGSAR